MNAYTYQHRRSLFEDDENGTAIEKVRGVLRNPNKCTSENRDNTGSTTLHHFIKTANEKKENTIKLLKLLINPYNGFPLDDALALLDRSLLVHLAVEHSKPAILKVLLDRVPEHCLKRDSIQNTPLHIAARSVPETKTQWKQMKAVIKLLVQTRMAAVNKVDQGHLTPVHVAVKAGNYWAFNFMISRYLEQEVMVEDPKTEPLLHYLCSFDCASNTNWGKMLKKSLKLHASRRTLPPAWLNVVNANRRNRDKVNTTPLENAIINEQPNTLKVLMLVKDIKVNRGMYYAAMNGGTARGNECANILLDNLSRFDGHDLETLFETQDTQQNNIFDCVIRNCTTDTVKKLLDFVLGLGYKQRKMTLNNQFVHKSFEEAPDVVLYLLEKSFCYTSKKNRQSYLHCDISSVTGVTNQRTLDLSSVTDKILLYSFTTPETELLRNSISNWDYDKKKAILLHPAVKFYVFEKYRRNQLPMIFLLIFQVVWVLNLALFAQFTFRTGGGTPSVNCGSIINFLYALGSLVYEVLEAKRCGRYYFINLTNAVQLLRDLLLIGSSGCLWVQYTEESKSCTAIGIILAYVLAMRHLRNVGKTVGQSIDILRQVCQTVFTVLLSCWLILFGFTQAIVLLFTDGSTTAPINIVNINTSLPVSFYKVLAMMAGELEFNNIGANLISTEEAILTWPTLIARNLIFVLFLVGIVFAFFNQLTGVALDEIQILIERADVLRVISKIEYIYFVESLMGLLFRFVKAISKFWAFLKRLCKPRQPAELESSTDIENNGSHAQLPWFESWLIRFSVIEIVENTDRLTDLIKVKLASESARRQQTWFRKFRENFPDIDQPSDEDIRAMHALAEKNLVLNKTDMYLL